VVAHVSRAWWVYQSRHELNRSDVSSIWRVSVRKLVEKCTLQAEDCQLPWWGQPGWKCLLYPWPSPSLSLKYVFPFILWWLSFSIGREGWAPSSLVSVLGYFDFSKPCFLKNKSWMTSVCLQIWGLDDPPWRVLSGLCHQHTFSLWLVLEIPKKVNFFICFIGFNKKVLTLLVEISEDQDWFLVASVAD